MAPRRDRTRRALAIDHPTSVAFLDESGSIAQDRIFAVGCLKLENPSVLLRALQRLRDRRQWYAEIHFQQVKDRAIPIYQEIIELIAATSGATFSCFVADRHVADPVQRFGSPWRAYEKLATQLLLGSIAREELVTVLADDYSTPPGVQFEVDVREEVNRRLGRLGVVSICRLSSHAADGLQLVDLLTSAVCFEYRQSVGLAATQNPKAELAHFVRQTFAVDSFLNGHRDQRLNVAQYADLPGPEPQ